MARLHATPDAVPSLVPVKFAIHGAAGDNRWETGQEHGPQFKHVAGCLLRSAAHSVADQAERQTTRRRGGTEEESKRGAASERTPLSLSETPAPDAVGQEGRSKMDLHQDEQGSTPSVCGAMRASVRTNRALPQAESASTGLCPDEQATPLALEQCPRRGRKQGVRWTVVKQGLTPGVSRRHEDRGTLQGADGHRPKKRWAPSQGTALTGPLRVIF